MKWFMPTMIGAFLLIVIVSAKLFPLWSSASAQPLWVTTKLREQPAQKYPISQPELRPLVEQRYCGVPQRDENGEIHRSAAVTYAFQKIHPCPANGATKSACPGWAIDHVIPLACGGCDAVSNMQWLPLDLKSSKKGKDRFERSIYCSPMKQVVR